jgi:hypothetical protein
MLFLDDGFVESTVSKGTETPQQFFGKNLNALAFAFEN